MVIPATWTMEVEDGQRSERIQRLGRAPVADLGCRGAPRNRRNHDDDVGGADGGGRRSWKDALLRHGRTPSQQPQAPVPVRRHRSCSPAPRRHHMAAHGRRAGDKRPSASNAKRSQRCHPSPRSPRAAAGSEPTQNDICSDKGKDPVEDFFREAKRPILASMIVDNAAADVQAAADAVVAAPLDFDNNMHTGGAATEAQLVAFGPTLASPSQASGQFNRCAPTQACTLEMQLGAVTYHVCQLEIANDNKDNHPQITRRLFVDAPAPIIANAPPRRPSAPPKARAPSVPTRQRARQAASNCKTPVSQRASLRIVKELGLLGPKDKMTKEVADALIRRFDEPLTDNDIAVIAKLTRLDKDSPLIAAGLAGPDGAANVASV
ncbi:hypothetical protein VPH35_050460 [Triticum aestivum]